MERAKQGPKLFSADEIRRLVDAASPAMKAMILFAINCGFGNAVCGRLPLNVLDLENGWVDFPLPKTGIGRCCSLWPETIAAIKKYLDHRPKPKNEADAGLLFITKYGLPWYKDNMDNPISKETAKLLKALGINGRRGLNFYTLRHTFRTVADKCKDQPAVDFVMGHEMQRMSTVYRETIDDERLQAVADVVRSWLFGDQDDLY